jgi:toxin YoeB
MKTWKLLILKKAEDDLAWFRQHDRALYVKCFDLIRDTSKEPRSGLGKPERLKYFEREVWSRRISHEHRLVYVIYPEEQQIEIISCKSHYESLNL